MFGLVALTHFINVLPEHMIVKLVASRLLPECDCWANDDHDHTMDCARGKAMARLAREQTGGSPSR